MWSKQIHNTISKKYCCKLIQIQWKINLSANFINQIHTQFHTDCWSWLGSKCECKNQQIQIKKLTNTCKKTGGDELQNWRCSSDSCSVATNARMKVLSIESGSPYPDYSNKSTFSWVQAILKAQEACKVKLSCFKGIVHPTHFQKQVGWGTWLLKCLTSEMASIG